MTIRVLIADDYSIVRYGLRGFLSSDTDIEVVAEVADGAEAIRLSRLHQPDVVLMDLIMPVIDGLAATAAVRHQSPRTAVLVLTCVLDDATILAAMQAGAIGFLLKDVDQEELFQAINAAVAGHAHLSPQAAKRLKRQIGVAEEPEALSPRETEVLRLVGQGKSNAEIAYELKIREKTVKTHVGSILGKLGFYCRTQAALYAVHTGLVSGYPWGQVIPPH